MPDFMDLMKKAKEMQTKMQEAKEKMANQTIDVQTGGGLVKMTFSGEGNAMALHIDPSLLTPQDGEIVQDLILAAFQEAKVRIEGQQAEFMQKSMGGMPLPPNMKMPF